MKPLPTGIDATITCCETILEGLDPFYWPARALCGYAHLKKGSAAEAAGIFAKLLEEIDFAQESAAAEVLDKWVGLGPRKFIKYVTWLPFIKSWCDRYIQETRHIIGGDFANACKAWEEIKIQMEELEKKSEERSSAESSSLSDWNTTATKHMISQNIEILAEFQLDDLARVAIGERKDPERRPEHARRDLDRLLNLRELDSFRTNLLILKSSIKIKSILIRRKSDPDSDAMTGLEPLLEKLEKPRFSAVYFKEELGRLRRAIKELNWDACEREIKRLEDQTEESSLHHMKLFVNDPEVMSFSAGMASFFIPVLGYIRHKYVKRFNPLYEEVKYHLALARLWTDEPDQIELMLESIGRITEPPKKSWPWPGKALKDVEIGRICLELQADAWKAERKEDGGRANLWTVSDEKKAALENAAKSTRKSFRVRAQAWTALGMLARDDAALKGIAAEKGDSAIHEARAELARQMEFHCFRSALELEPDAMTHCHLARALFGEKRAAEAKMHVEQALRMSPELPAARRLREKIASAMGPETAAPEGRL